MFKNRHEAGLQLVDLLEDYRECKNAIVIGLPRGGVVTAAIVAKALKLPLDVICARKLGAPFSPEFAIGAVTESGTPILDTSLTEQNQIDPAYLLAEIKKETAVSKKRQLLFRQGKPPLSFKDKVVILVDDGLATGFTMRAAIEMVKKGNPRKIVLAVPIAPADTVKALQKEVEEVIVITTPTYFIAIGAHYEDFRQIEDAEVLQLLNDF